MAYLKPHLKQMQCFVRARCQPPVPVTASRRLKVSSVSWVSAHSAKRLGHLENRESVALKIEQVFQTQSHRGDGRIAESAQPFLEPCFVEDTDLVRFGDAVFDFAIKQYVLNDFSCRNKDPIRRLGIRLV
jgi:hypothetical protein